MTAANRSEKHQQISYRSEGQVTRRHRRLLPGRPGPVELADSPARRRAAERWQSGEPVLAALAGVLGIPADAAPAPAVGDESVVAVVAAVGDAVTELDAVRQRREIEQAAFDNVWRGE